MNENNTLYNVPPHAPTIFDFDQLKSCPQSKEIDHFFLWGGVGGAHLRIIPVSNLKSGTHILGVGLIGNLEGKIGPPSPPSIKIGLSTSNAPVQNMGKNQITYTSANELPVT